MCFLKMFFLNKFENTKYEFEKKDQFNKKVQKIKTIKRIRIIIEIKSKNKFLIE